MKPCEQRGPMLRQQKWIFKNLQLLKQKWHQGAGGVISGFTGKWIAKCWITRHLPDQSSELLRVSDLIELVSAWWLKVYWYPDFWIKMRRVWDCYIPIFGMPIYFVWWSFGTQLACWSFDPTPKLWNESQCQSKCLLANSPFGNPNSPSILRWCSQP